MARTRARRWARHPRVVRNRQKSVRIMFGRKSSRKDTQTSTVARAGTTRGGGGKVKDKYARQPYRAAKRSLSRRSKLTAENCLLCG